MRCLEILAFEGVPTDLGYRYGREVGPTGQCAPRADLASTVLTGLAAPDRGARTSGIATARIGGTVECCRTIAMRDTQLTGATGLVFDHAFRFQLLDLYKGRRDVRRIRPEPVPANLPNGFVEVAAFAPSASLNEPWRFVKVDYPARRAP